MNRSAADTAISIVRRALVRSGFRRALWPRLVVVVRFNDAEAEVLPRDQFASWLQHHDLGRAAHECTARHISPGEALVWAEIDTQGLSAAGFSKVRI